MEFSYNNKNTFRIFLFLFFIFGKIGIGLFAQSSISGKITDNKTNEELMEANVIITNSGGFIYKKKVDKKGNFKMNLDAGEYIVMASSIGYPSFEIENIIVFQEQETKLDIELESTNVCGGGVVCSYKIPLLNTDITTSGEIIITEDVRHMGFKKFPTRNINNISTIAPGVSFTQ